MKPLCSVRTMKEIEKAAMAKGLSYTEMIRRAGKAIADNVPIGAKRIAIVCGKGNNGGDGYSAACFLFLQGRETEIIQLEKDVSRDALYFYEKCKDIGVKCIRCNELSDFSLYDVIIDCIFGTGFYGEMPAEYRKTVSLINESGKYVLSADIPSGIDGNNGLSSTAVTADKTVVFGSYKYGNVLQSAKDYSKENTLVDIGLTCCGEKYVLEEKDFLPFLQKRKNNSHKGVYGYTAIFGGCENYSGAVKLADMACAALYSGSGVIRLAVPKDIFPYVAPHVIESTLFDETETELIVAGVSAIGIGCGWGRNVDRESVLRHILQKASCPIVVDADGLFALKNIGFGIMEKNRYPVVLTPHYGEMARLADLSVKEIENDPIGVAEGFASKNKCIVVLKGPSTVITDGLKTYVCTRGCAGMATAGSGDVLTGIMVGVLGQYGFSLLSVAYATFINGVSGEMAQEKYTDIGMTSLDTVHEIRSAISRLRDNNGIV